MKWQEIPTPCYVVDEKKLKQNLKILQNLEQELPHTAGAESIFSICRISADWKIYKRNYGQWNI